VTMTDPIADMLTRIRNGVSARHDNVQMPSSKIKISIAKVLKEEGFIRDFQVSEEAPRSMLKIDLSYTGRKEPVLSGIKRVSKPGLRVYVQKREIPRVLGGLGVAILSTPEGVMTGQNARQKAIGGEVLCYVW
jgi:small subunit ribosomal protein S8